MSLPARSGPPYSLAQPASRITSHLPTSTPVFFSDAQPFDQLGRADAALVLILFRYPCLFHLPCPPVMSSKSRKRSRAITDENRADCPFTISMVTAPSSEERDHIAKKRKRDADEDGAASNNHKKELVQMSPFEPRGKFKSNQSMNLAYAVEPRKRWQDMTRYNSFVCESRSRHATPLRLHSQP